MRRCFGGTKTLEYNTSFAVVIASSQKFSATMRLTIDRGKTLIRFVQKHNSSLITTLSQVAMTSGDNIDQEVHRKTNVYKIFIITRLGRINIRGVVWETLVRTVKTWVIK